MAKMIASLMQSSNKSAAQLICYCSIGVDIV